MIHNFKSFLKEEISRNEPIPEIYGEKIGVFLLGAPGIGKSTFANNILRIKNPGFKTFSTDDISYLFTKDPNLYYEPSAKLNIEKLKLYIKESGKSFIYDTTGTVRENILEIFNLSKECGYKTVFIHLIGELKLSIYQNLQRDRQVDLDYLKDTYNKQFKLMSEYSKLPSDSYYIVLNREGRYRYYKYSDGKILIKKLDTYISVSESVESESKMKEINDFVIAFQHLLDEKYSVLFIDFFGNSCHPEVLQSNKNLLRNFKVQVNENYKKIIVEIDLNKGDYEEFSDLIYHLYPGVMSLMDKNWKLDSFNIDYKSEGQGVTQVHKFKSIRYSFSQIGLMKITPDRESLGMILDTLGFELDDYVEDEQFLDVYFYSKSYSGKMGSNLDSKMKKIVDYFNFDSYEIIDTDSSSVEGRVIFYL